MSDFEPTPDDLTVSAVLDGVASSEEIERVAADPRLASRLAQFRVVAEAVGGPVPLVDTTVREAHLARALAEGTSAAAPPPPPPPPPPPETVDLAAARARRRTQPRYVAILSAAAVLVLVVAAGAFLLQAGNSGGGGDAEVAATDQAPVESSGGTRADAAVPFEPDADADAGTAPEPNSTAGGPATTIAGGSATESALDPTLPDLGRFSKADDLVTRVRAELVLDPTARALTTDEPCQDDFGVPVILLGRASLDGEEGLVYVEQAQTTGRRVWLVSPAFVDTAGADCRQITPVQSL